MKQDLPRQWIERFRDQGAALDREPAAVKAAIASVLNDLHGRFPSQEEVDAIFEVSPTLGFTIWQHFAALRILSQNEPWRLANRERWAAVSTHRQLVGFATTHLAYSRPNHARLEGGKIHGLAPWSSGYGIFDSFILGCRDGTETLLLYMPYPPSAAENARGAPVSFRRLSLAALNGTSSIGLEFNGADFAPEDLVARHATWPPAVHAQTRLPFVDFVLPEIGLLRAILGDLERELERYPGVRKARFAQAVETLKSGAEKLHARRARYLADLSGGRDGRSLIYWRSIRLTLRTLFSSKPSH